MSSRDKAQQVFQKTGLPIWAKSLRDLGGYVVADAVRTDATAIETETAQHQQLVPSVFDEDFLRRIPPELETDSTAPIILVGEVQGTNIQVAVFEGKPDPTGDWNVCNLVADKASPGGALTCSRPSDTALGVTYGGDWPDNLVWGPVPEEAVEVELIVDEMDSIVQAPVALHAVFVRPLSVGLSLHLKARDSSGTIAREKTFLIP